MYLLQSIKLFFRFCKYSHSSLKILQMNKTPTVDAKSSILENVIDEFVLFTLDLLQEKLSYISKDVLGCLDLSRDGVIFTVLRSPEYLQCFLK